MWAHIMVITAGLHARLTERWKAGLTALRDEPEAGYASEAVLVTALLVLGAIVVIAIIVAKVTGKANEIDLGWMTPSAAR